MAGPIFNITQADLLAAWGPETFTQIFGDAKGIIDVTAVNLVISRASMRVIAKLPHNYTGVLPFPDPIPELVKDATIEYCWAFGVPRNLDLMRELGETRLTLLKPGDNLMEEIRQAVSRLIDAAAPRPANVGGKVGAIGSNSPDNPPKRWFDDMGDW
jgi:hypothetical protein